jgi:hypothetical protein
MEILDMTLAGIPVGTALVVGAVCYNGRYAYREWRKHRTMVRELKQHQREFDAEHEWKPCIVNGIDCGEWVRKDGRPIFDD